MPGVVGNRLLTGLVLMSLLLLPAGVSMAGEPEKKAKVKAVFIGDDSAAFLGVQIEEETEYEEGGARVTSVVEGSPAEEAGLEDGDIIVGFDGDTVRGPVGLTMKIHAREPGDRVSITLVRDGERRTLEAELGDRADRLSHVLEMSFLGQIPHEFEIPEIDLEIDKHLQENLERLKDRYIDLRHCEGDDCEFRQVDIWIGKPQLGVQLVEATPELREHLGGTEDAGVLVSKVLPRTPAKEAGIRVGDLIVEVGGESVSSSSDIRRALREKTGETFEVKVIRDGTPKQIEVTLPETDEDSPTGPRAFFLPSTPDAPLPARAPCAAPRAIALPPLPSPSKCKPQFPVAAPKPPPKTLRRFHDGGVGVRRPIVLV